MSKMMKSLFCMNAFISFTLFAFICCYDPNDTSISKTRSNKLIPRSFTNKAHSFLSANDLKVYLSALKKIVNFCKYNQNEIDMNFAFGLFLINVNLKVALRDHREKIPLKLFEEISNLLKLNSRLLTFFYSMVEHDNDTGNRLNKHISTLFWNDTLWVSRIPQIGKQKTRLQRFSYSRLELAYHKWNKYSDAFFDWHRQAVPGPAESDRCIASMVENSIRYFHTVQSCSLRQECYAMILNGSDYGYSLTHRLLTLLVAHYAQGCAIFSWNTDMELVVRFCHLAYAEAQYIAFHNYGLMLDVFMEQIAFCALQGYKEFLQRSWLQDIIKRQRKLGCFGNDYKPKAPRLRKKTDLRMRLGQQQRRKWTMAKKDYAQDIVGGKCNGHVTAVAAAAIASAVRYIIATKRLQKSDSWLTNDI